MSTKEPSVSAKKPLKMPKNSWTMCIVFAKEPSVFAYSCIVYLVDVCLPLPRALCVRKQTRCLHKRGLYTRKRALYVRNRARYLRKRALYVAKEPAMKHVCVCVCVCDIQGSFAEISGSVADIQGSFACIQASFMETPGLFCDIQGYETCAMKHVKLLCVSLSVCQEPSVSAKEPCISAKEP